MVTTPSKRCRANGAGFPATAPELETGSIMKTSESFLAGRMRRGWVGLLVLAVGLPAWGAMEITEVTTRDVPWVIASDALMGYERAYHQLQGEVEVTFAGPRAEVTVRASLEVVDENGNWVALVPATTNTPQHTQPAMGDGETAVVTLPFALEFEDPMESDRQYRVRAKLWRRVQIGSQWHWMDAMVPTVDSSPQPYFHFTNMDSDDAGRNMKARVREVTWERDWRVKTVDGPRGDFLFHTNILLSRYDGFARSPAEVDGIGFELRVVLTDDLGATIPLEYPAGGVFAMSEQMRGYADWGAGRIPWEEEIDVDLAIRPAVQLDPVNRQYTLAVEVWYPDTLGNPMERLSRRATAARRLLDFNGNLRFGSGATAITVQMTDASRTATPWQPVPIFPPSYLLVEMNLAEIGVEGVGMEFSGAPGVVSVRLWPSGLATYMGAADFTISAAGAPGMRDVQASGIRYQMGSNITLTSSGGTVGVGIDPLPAGMGVLPRHDLPWWVTFFSMGESMLVEWLPVQTVALGGDLRPASTVTWTGDYLVSEETKPVLIEATAIQWDVQAGRLNLATTGTVNNPESERRDVLANAPAGTPYLDRPSNADYWLLVDGVDTSVQASIRQAPVDPVAGSNAALTARFTVTAGQFETHFPRATVSVGAAGGAIRVQDDLIVSSQSYLDGAQMSVAYLAGDPSAPPGACGGAAGAELTLDVEPDNAQQRLGITPTGGLHAVCKPVGGAGMPLRWGFIGGTQYAFSTDPFTSAGFYAPGTFYPQARLDLAEGEDAELAHKGTPGQMHLTGFVAGQWRFADMEASGTAAYRTNTLRADYAGVNLRVENEAEGFQGQSIISGQAAAPYPLKEHCRYYARRSGVTGIHDALGGPTGAVLYGFPSYFDSYGFAFRDSRVVESVTDGGLAVPYPSEFALPMEKIRFSASGNPLDARLPEALSSVTLAYWNCEMIPLALAFSSTDPCDPSNGLLRVQAGVNMPNLGDTLYGEMGFLSNGEIATATAGVAGLTSRLKAPNHVTFRGPRKPSAPGSDVRFEWYTLTPVTDVYLNNHADHPSPEPRGFLNLAGHLGVAFFEDLAVHVQTTAGVPGQEESAPLHVTGGWSVGSETFFNSPETFDPGHRGFPQGKTLEQYRSERQYRPEARRNWMGIPFRYELVWDNATRSFRSAEEQDTKVDLLVLEADHRLEYLSAEEASLRFGATYTGIPQIGLGNMLVNAVDEVTGVLAAIEDALSAGVGEVLQLGSDAAARLLNDNLDELIGPVIEDALRAGVEQYVLEPLSHTQGLIPEEEWAAEMIHSLTSQTSWLRSELGKLGNLEDLQPAFLAELQAQINQIASSLDVWIDPTEGLLAVDANGNYLFASDLVFSLIDKLAGPDIKSLLGISSSGTAAQAINAEVTRHINRYAPALGTMRERLLRLRGQLVDLSNRLDLTAGGQLAQVIQGYFDNAADEIDAMAQRVASELQGHLRTWYAAVPEAFLDEDNRRETADFLIRRVRDHITAGVLARQIQTLLRQQLQDLQAGIDETIDSMFSGFRRLIRDVVEEKAGALDDAVEGMLGDLGSVVRAGSIEGHALIRGDRLDHLRLDARFELDLDESMRFHGFLEINQIDGGGYGSNAREVKLGAIDTPMNFLGGTADFTIVGRIVLDGSNRPLGLGGSFEMTRGELSFESFTITDLGAAVMFGVSENYVAAKLGMEFASFRVAGGLFVGRSNSLEPLRMVDPDVADVIPLDRITGVYVYGEVFMPIVDFSCLFRVSAGLGVGAFYFVEGPTYGGKIYAAVEGQALCVVTVRGEVMLIGVKSDIMRFRGSGRISGKVGSCPFCLKFGKSVGFTYDRNSGFKANY